MTSLSLTTVFILVHVCLHLLKKVNANYACFEQKPKISASCNKHWSLTPSRLEKNFFSSECIDFFEKYPDLQADQCVETIVVSIEAYDSSSAFLARMSLKEENGVFFVPFPDTVNHFYIKRYLVGYGNYYAERINPVEENDSFTFSEVFHFYRHLALGVTTKTSEKPKWVDLFLHKNALIGYVSHKTPSVNVHGPLGTRPLAVHARGLFFSETVGPCSLAVKISKPPLAYAVCSVVLHFCVDLSSASLAKTASGHFLFERGVNQRKLDLASSIVAYVKATFSSQSEIHVHMYNSRVFKTLKDSGSSPGGIGLRSFAESVRKAEQYIDTIEPGDLGQCLKIVSAEGDRHKVLFVLSDGSAADVNDTKKAAEKLMNDGWNIISASFGGMADATLLRDIALKGYFFTEEQLYESLQSRENFLTKMCWSIKFTKKGVAKLLGVYSVAVCAFVVAWAALMVKEKLRKRVRDISMIDATSHHFELAPSVNVKCTDIMIN